MGKHVGSVGRRPRRRYGGFSFGSVKVLYSVRECSKLGVAGNGKPVASASLAGFGAANRLCSSFQALELV